MDNECKEHSGVCEALDRLKCSDEKQWEAIEELRRWPIKILVSMIIAVLVGLINVIMNSSIIRLIEKLHTP